jgi:hypothetical protein
MKYICNCTGDMITAMVYPNQWHVRDHCMLFEICINKSVEILIPSVVRAWYQLCIVPLEIELM